MSKLLNVLITFAYRLSVSIDSLLVKPPLANKTLKNNTFFHGREAHADKISLLKSFLHKCGRAGISSKQLKKIKQNKRM